GMDGRWQHRLPARPDQVEHALAVDIPALRFLDLWPVIEQRLAFGARLLHRALRQDVADRRRDARVLGVDIETDHAIAGRTANNTHAGIAALPLFERSET